MLKKDILEEELKIYEIYVQRIMKECDLIWSRFKIYFGFNSGALIIIGFLLKPYISTLSDISDVLLCILKSLSFLGILFSIAWFLINRNGRKWMLFMNDVLGKVEGTIFEKEDCALYKQINKEYPPQTKLYEFKGDTMDISCYISILFIIIWIILFCFLVTLGDC
jgi:hypothetical protein